MKHLCYNKYDIFFGVNVMENEHLEEMDTEDTGYTPRPAWQVWTARIGLALFILVIVLYYINMFRG